MNLPVKAFAMDVWVALGLPPSRFNEWYSSRDRADAWAQLMCTIRKGDLEKDTNPPAGILLDLLKQKEG